MLEKISRRRALQGAGACALSVCSSSAWPIAASHSSSILFAGTQTSGSSKGIYTYRFDASSGKLTLIALAAETVNPTFLALSPDRTRLFAVNEIEDYQDTKNGSLSSFTLGRRGPSLEAVNQVSSLGGAPCHVSVDATGKCVFVANYSGGSTSSYRVDVFGRLSEAVSFFQFTGRGPDTTRQQSPHAHRVTVTPGNRFLLVNDLGLDLIHIYRLNPNTAELVPHDPPAWKAPPGSGPRALRFHPNGRWAYCVTEMKSTVILLHWNPSHGTLETAQEIALLPPDYHGEKAGDDIVLDRSGRFAYAANRFDDYLVVFAISPADGKLNLLQRISCGGRVPRHLTLDKTERWILVANQESDNLVVFSRDPRTGKLSGTTAEAPLSRPQCLLFF